MTETAIISYAERLNRYQKWADSQPLPPKRFAPTDLPSVAIITVPNQRTSGTAPFHTHFSALASCLAAGTIHTTRYEWRVFNSFGEQVGYWINDPRCEGRKINTAQASGGNFIFDHVFETDDTYTVTLDITTYDTDGTVHDTDQDTQDIIVNAFDGSDYYFSAAGNDTTGDGSIGTPWRSFDKAHKWIDDNALPANGVRMNFNRGDTYDNDQQSHSKSGSKDQPIIFQAYGSGARPVITCNAAADRCFPLTITGYRVLDLDFRGPGIGTSTGNFATDTNGDVLVLRVNVQDFQAGFGWDTGTVDNFLVQETTFNVQYYANYAKAMRYMAYLGCDFGYNRNLAGRETLFRTQSVIQLTIRACRGDGGADDKECITIRGDSQYVLVQDSYFSVGVNDPGHGVSPFIIKAQNPAFEENQRDIIVERCRFYAGDTFGSSAVGPSSRGIDVTVRNCICVTDYLPMKDFFSLDKNGHAASLEPTGNHVYGNSSYNGNASVSGTAVIIRVGSSVAYSGADFLARNNAYSMPNVTSSYSVFVTELPNDANYLNAQFLIDHNYGYYPNASTPTIIASCDSEYTVAGWQATGNGRGVGSALTDPKFNNAASADFTPQSDSPLIADGVAVPGFFDDYWGHDRTLASPSVGALEHTLPTFTSCTPAKGTSAGGTSVTIAGTNFYGTRSVTVNGVACTSLVEVSDTSITCITPAATAAGPQDIIITGDYGSVTEAAGFNYTLTASVAGTSTASGVLSFSGSLAGAAAGTSTAVSVLTGVGSLISTAAGTSTGAGVLVGVGSLVSTSAGTSTAAGVIQGTGKLIGVSAGTSVAVAIVASSTSATSIADEEYVIQYVPTVIG
jgi:hypothetical protein